ncbi:MAG TPA: dihydrofolate reductase family protein [Gaiellaceae bacterium]
MIVYYAALSLDGRIAGPDHDLSFLQTLSRGPAGDYESFYDGCDSLVMGGGTWEFMVRHGSWPYAGKPCWLVSRSHTPDEVPGAEPVETFAGDLRELVALIEARGLHRTWLIGGGDLAGQLLAADLLDELILTVAPTLVGRGPALADGDFPLRRFTLTEVSRWSENGARLRYER